MGMTTARGRERLAQEVLARKAALDLTKEQAAVAAGISVTTWTKVEQALEVQDRKYNGVDRALQWDLGTAIRIATERGERTRASDPPSGNSRIAQMLREAMIEDGLSQSELEERADMPAGALTRYLAGDLDDDPSEETRLQLGRAAGLPQSEVDEAIEADLGLEPGDLRDIDLWRRLPLNQRRLVRELLTAIGDDESRSRRNA